MSLYSSLTVIKKASYMYIYIYPLDVAIMFTRTNGPTVGCKVKAHILKDFNEQDRYAVALVVDGLL